MFITIGPVRPASQSFPNQATRARHIEGRNTSHSCLSDHPSDVRFESRYVSAIQEWQSNLLTAQRSLDSSAVDGVVIRADLHPLREPLGSNVATAGLDANPIAEGVGIQVG